MAGGVHFDLNGNGVREKLPWTAPGSNDAWLALDRDENGFIESGGELFGNYTSQEAAGVPPNGFLALGVFDRFAAGGNHDGWIDQLDLIYEKLRLWVDANHDGVSQAEEMKLLRDAGVIGFRSIIGKRAGAIAGEMSFATGLQVSAQGRIGLGTCTSVHPPRDTLVGSD